MPDGLFLPKELKYCQFWFLKCSLKKQRHTCTIFGQFIIFENVLLIFSLLFKTKSNQSLCVTMLCQHSSWLILILLNIKMSSAVVGNSASAFLSPCPWVGTTAGVPGWPRPQLSEGVGSLWPDTWLASPSGDLKVKGCGLLLPALPRGAAVRKRWWQPVTFYRPKIKPGEGKSPPSGIPLNRKTSEDTVFV